MLVTQVVPPSPALPRGRLVMTQQCMVEVGQLWGGRTTSQLFPLNTSTSLLFSRRDWSCLGLLICLLISYPFLFMASLPFQSFLWEMEEYFNSFLFFYLHKTLFTN